jgi:outer membrane protein OmpA-like peptidoglycan-associated protein
MFRSACLAAALLASPGAFAEPPSKDIPGTADPAAFGRYEGAVIVDHVTKPYDEVSFPVAKWDQRKRLPERTLDVEGVVTRVVYFLPKERSPLEVLRNYQEVLEKGGGKILWECDTADIGAGGDCGKSGGDYVRHDGKVTVAEYLAPVGTLPSDGDQYLQSCLFLGKNGDLRYFAGEMELDGIKTHIGMATWIKNAGRGCRDGMGKDKLDISMEEIKEQPVALVVTVDEKEREQKMVTVAADELTSAIEAGEKVALYGITFDFDKADIKPESKPQLDEIGRLLSDSPDLKLVVAGHTDNQGGADYNLDLSKRRADAVVAVLVEDYGIAADRLQAEGFGAGSPVAGNDSEEGRAKNRRVELSRQ